MLADTQWKMLENAKDPLDRMKRKRDASVYVCINTVIMCSGVCMNWYRVGTLLKGGYVYFMSDVFAGLL